LLALYSYQGSQHPTEFPSVENIEVTFIGSSLAGNALPTPVPENGVLGGARSCAILFVPAISEMLSTRLVAYAINSGVRTIFIEINAYATEYLTVDEPAILRSMTAGILQTGGRLTISVKALLKSDPKPDQTVDCGTPKPDRSLDAAQLSFQDFYRIHKTEPSHSDALRAVLARARDANVEVFFFYPPRPQSAVDMMGSGEFKDLNLHLERLADLYEVPLWYSPIPWPDDHFMDILAHTNERGRIRFQKELADWHRKRQ
jgi:hypothetical protein